MWSVDVKNAHALDASIHSKENVVIHVKVCKTKMFFLIVVYFEMVCGLTFFMLMLLQS